MPNVKKISSSRRILTCYYRPKPGGFCKRLFRAINALLDRGHTVHYLAVVPFPIDHQNCHFHRFPWFENHTSGYFFWGVFHLFAPLQLLFIGIQNHINCLFAFGGHNYAMFLQPLRIIKQIPLTFFVRGDSIEKHRINRRSRLLVELETFLEGLGIVGTRLYGVSETLTNKIIERHRVFKPLRSGVLHNDIVKQFPRSNIRRTGTSPLCLACVGLLEKGKNQRFIVEVMKEITANRAQLYLYGVGPDETLLKEVVKKNNMMDRVHFMGWVASEKIWSDVDILLMPSLHEGSPNAVLEALGYGIPVLASDIMELAEILPENSLLPLGEVKMWVEMIEDMISNQDVKIQELVREQEEFVRYLLFDWEKAIVQCLV